MPLQPRRSYAPGRGGRGGNESAIHFSDEEASVDADADPVITDSVTVDAQDPKRREGGPGTKNSAEISIWFLGNHAVFGRRRRRHTLCGGLSQATMLISTDLTAGRFFSWARGPTARVRAPQGA